MKMVATVDRVPVYVRASQLGGADEAAVIQKAIEGEIVVQCEPAFEINFGSEVLRSELERRISKTYPDREAFHTELEREGMTYEDYIYEQRRIAARDGFEAWALEYIKIKEARAEGRKPRMDKTQATLSEEENSVEHRRQVWLNFIESQKQIRKVVLLPADSR